MDAPATPRPLRAKGFIHTSVMRLHLTLLCARRILSKRLDAGCHCRVCRLQRIECARSFPYPARGSSAKLVESLGPPETSAERGMESPPSAPATRHAGLAWPGASGARAREPADPE